MFFDIPRNPNIAKPIMQRFLQENIGATQAALGSYNRPQPPRSILAQQGPVSVLLTWNAPQNTNYVLGYRIYQDNENNLILDIANPATTQATIQAPASGGLHAYYVSTYSTQMESIKVRVVAPQGGSSTMPTPSIPPKYENEPTGGGAGGNKGNTN